MRSLVRLGAVFAIACSAISIAARIFTEFISFAFVRVVRAVTEIPQLFAVLNGTALVPATAGYVAPPDSELRHEAFVSHRSAARGT